MEHRRYQVTSVERSPRFPWSVISTTYHTIRSWPYFRLVRATTPGLFGPRGYSIPSRQVRYFEREL